MEPRGRGVYFYHLGFHEAALAAAKHNRELRLKSSRPSKSAAVSSQGMKGTKSAQRGDAMQINQERLDQFMGQVVRELGAAMNAAPAVIGD